MEEAVDSKEETKGKLCKPETSLHKHLPSELAEVFPKVKPLTAVEETGDWEDTIKKTVYKNYTQIIKQ